MTSDLECNAAVAVPLALISFFLRELALGLQFGMLDGFLFAGVLTILAPPISLLFSRWPFRMLRRLLQHRDGAPVFFLRAFRSDRICNALRASLQALLGPGYQLVRIRPPAKRAGLFYRLFFTVPTGLRYLGSPSFGLKAARPQLDGSPSGFLRQGSVCLH